MSYPSSTKRHGYSNPNFSGTWITSLSHICAVTALLVIVVARELFPTAPILDMPIVDVGALSAPRRRNCINVRGGCWFPEVSHKHFYGSSILPLATKDNNMVNEFQIDNAYKRRYKMRAVGENGLNIIVSIPRVVIVKEAESRGLSFEDFLKNFRAVAHYNSFEGIHYLFEENKQPV